MIEITKEQSESIIRLVESYAQFLDSEYYSELDYEDRKLLESLKEMLQQELERSEVKNAPND